MGYDIILKDLVTNEVLNFDAPHQIKDGTYVIGGTKEVWLKISCNYSQLCYNNGSFKRKW